MSEFINLILQPLQAVLIRFESFLPHMLAALVIFVIGTLLAWGIRLMSVKLLKALGFDSWSDRMGVTVLMRKGHLWDKPSIALGAILFWVLMIFTLMAGLSALEMTAMDTLVEQFFSYIPRAVSALMIFAIGYVVIEFVCRTILIAAVNRGFNYAKLLADTVRILLTLLILAMVMEQLQVAPGIVLAAFSIIFGGIVVALAIAFGVGGIEAARRVIESELAKGAGELNKEDVEHI